MPLHAFVMIFAALFSFVSIFIPMFELFVQYVPVRNYSLFTLILSPYYQSKLRSGPVDLNFQTFAAWMFVVSIVLAVAALTLSASYPFYSESKGKKRTGCFFVLALFVARAVVHAFTLSKMVSEEMINSNNLTPERLYVAQGFAGNILTIVLFIGAVAALYGGLGLRMNYKLFAYPYIVWIVLFTILPLILRSMWLVGSSSISTFPLVSAICAKHSFALSPPLSTEIGLKTSSPLISTEPSIFLACCSDIRSPISLLHARKRLTQTARGSFCCSFFRCG